MQASEHVSTPERTRTSNRQECQKCGMPAGLDQQNPPQEIKTEPYKTHLAYVEERRNEEDGLEVLVEAMARLRGN